MIPDLNPYPEYRDSGVEWLGEIPAHWDVRRLKSACLFEYGESLPKETRRSGEIEVYGSNGRVGYHDTANTLAPCVVIGRKGSFGKVNYSQRAVFAIDTTYYVDGRFTSSDIRWLFYVLSWLKLDTVSRDSAVPGLDRGEAYQQLVLVPPPDEQAAIVRFLDAADRRIRQYIRAKQKLIKLLNEQKQAIIQQAVTRGLNPDAPMKDSGIEWLGEIPAHWEVKRIKQVCAVKGRIGFRGYTSDDLVEAGQGALALGATHLSSEGLIDLSKPIYISWEKYYESPEIMAKQGDVLLVQRGSTCGKVALIAEALGSATINPSLILLKDIAIESAFLFYFLKSKFAKEVFDSILSATAIPMLSQKQIENTFILVPSTDEQQQIVEFIRMRTMDIDIAIARAHSAITSMRLLRTRLIADVVTGKVDVCQAAFTLPEEFADDAALDAGDLIDEDELIEDEAELDTIVEGDEA